MMRVNIAVLNYNGKELLKECLPSVIRAAEKSSFLPKVTVIDNRSTDGSVEFLKENFPEVNVFAASANRVYSSYNEFFRSSDDDLIVVLNSDIKADENFLDPLVSHFEESDDILFVSSRMYSFDRKTYQGDRSKPKLHFGVISADTRYKGYEKLIKEKGYAFSTGNGIFDRKKFLKLGGFDNMYIPGRYEDVDLCYRGWKSGFKGIYEPKSIFYHKGYGTFCKEYKDKQIHGLVFKNSLIFMCKNITDKFMLMKMFIWLIPKLIYFIFTLRFFFICYFFQFLLKLPLVMRRKKAVQADFKITDKELLKIFKDK